MALPRGCSNQGLQDDINNIFEWSSKWGLDLSYNKCKILHLGFYNPMSLYFINNIPIDSVSYIRDLGIIISNFMFKNYLFSF